MPGDSSSKGTRGRAVLIALLFAPAVASAATPYLSFTSVTSPPYGFAPGQQVAFVYAIGDNAHVTTFVDDFVDIVDRAGTLRIEDAVGSNQHFGTFGDADFRRLRREHPAQRYLGVTAFTCKAADHQASGSEYDEFGQRVQRIHTWTDAVCDARLDVRDDRGRLLTSLNVRGEGTSPRAVQLSAEERDVAVEQAARHAAFNAADMITPRLTRETIELDPTAPSFDDAMSMIDSDRFTEARAIWETALRNNRQSAALYYDLGAICEAIGDTKAARQYLQTAAHLAPENPLYRQEMKRAGARRP